VADLVNSNESLRLLTKVIIHKIYSWWAGWYPLHVCGGSIPPEITNMANLLTIYILKVKRRKY
jgi:hypothetical protein